MDPHGLKVYLYFIAVWVVFWGTAGGIVCHKLRGRGRQGAIAGATLFIIGIMLVLLQEDPPQESGPHDAPHVP
ncbi:MAG: hypothetical protein QM775_30510 [Pirellulales bacterium]